MNFKKHIPNLFTLTNLLSGCVLVYMAVEMRIFETRESEFDLVYIFMALLGLSLVCDLLDGMIARALNVSSPIGLQLDSLADMVTFGVFPGILMVKLYDEFLSDSLLNILGFGITLFSALRLAKFNVDLTQTTYFKGLATPANAILILGIFILFLNKYEFLMQNGFNILLATTVISCYLLISDLPLFSFKLKKFELKKLLPQLLLLMAAVILFIYLGLNALAPIILVYIILSIIFRKTFVHA